MTTLTASQMIAGYEPWAARDGRHGAFATLSARMARASRIRTIRRELRSLDDRILRDIGLTRDEIEVMDP